MGWEELMLFATSEDTVTIYELFRYFRTNFDHLQERELFSASEDALDSMTNYEFSRMLQQTEVVSVDKGEQHNH